MASHKAQIQVLLCSFIHSLIIYSFIIYLFTVHASNNNSKVFLGAKVTTEIRADGSIWEHKSQRLTFCYGKIAQNKIRKVGFFVCFFVCLFCFCFLFFFKSIIVKEMKSSDGNPCCMVGG